MIAHNKIKRVFSLSILILALIIGTMAQVIFSQQVNAWGCDEAGQEARADFYGRNNIASFFNPCDSGGQCATGGSTGGPVPTELSGESNYEKVWNYFTGRGLSPIVTAGMMGNLEKESHGMNPWGLEGASYHGGQGLGIVQWTGPRRTSLEAALAAGGITPSDYTDANREKGLLLQLNYLWDEMESSYGGWDQFSTETTVGEMSYLDTVDPKGQFHSGSLGDMVGKGSLLHIHAKFVISGDQVNPDNGHGRIKERMQYGLDFFEQFGNGTGGDCASVGEGGLTFDQAKKLMQWYENGGWKPQGGPCSYAGSGGQCYDWSIFITSRILGGACGSTSAPGVAQEAITAGSPGATTWKAVTKESLEPFTVFSLKNSEHTGVILGIHDGKLIFTDLNVSIAASDTDTLYAGPGAGAGGSRVKVIDLSELDSITVGEGHEWADTPFAAPADAKDALSRMQNFMKENNIQ